MSKGTMHAYAAERSKEASFAPALLLPLLLRMEVELIATTGSEESQSSFLFFNELSVGQSTMHPDITSHLLLVILIFLFYSSRCIVNLNWGIPFAN